MEFAEGTALEKLATRKLKRTLQPVFETAIDRAAIPLRCDGAVLELAIDRGRIRGGGRSQRVSEIEIELKEGHPAAVAEIAERLARDMPVSCGVLSKAERGYALCADKAGEPAHALPILLDRSVTADRAFTTIGLSCLKQVLANREAVLSGEAEGIHQMRVGLRRLRGAISLFQRMVRDCETEAIKRDLKWLTDELGPAREYEVLIDEQVRPLRRSASSPRELRALNKEVQARREQALDKAKQAVESDRCRELGLRTALWLANGAWSRDEDPLARAHRELPAADFATVVLSRRIRKIVKKIDRVADLTPRKRHKLRIAVKKLRYEVGFFASLFVAKRRKHRRKTFENILKSLQDSLGKLNDIAVHRRLAKTVVHPQWRVEQHPEQAFAMGFVTGVEREQAERKLAAARKAGRKLAAATPFWR